MFMTQEQFSQWQRQSFETFQKLALVSLSSVEKLSQLNIEVSRAMISSASRVPAQAFAVRNVQGLAATLADSTATPVSLSAPGTEAGESLMGYMRQLTQIGQEASDEVAGIMERQYSERNRQIFAALDEFAQKAPTGSQGVMTLMKTAVTAASTAVDQMQQSSRRMAALTEQNVSKVVAFAEQHTQRTTALVSSHVQSAEKALQSVAAGVSAPHAEPALRPNGRAQDMQDHSRKSAAFQGNGKAAPAA